MTDLELAAELHRLKAQGPSARNELQALLKNEGGWSRLIGLIPVPKKARVASTALRTFLPDDFPDEKTRANAVAFWTERGRGDLVARLDEIVGDFRSHHGSEAHNTRAASWPGTWTTWYRNQMEFKRPGGGPKAVVTQLFVDATPDGWRKRLQAFEELGEKAWPSTWGPIPPNSRAPKDVVAEFERRKRATG
jgi:hypothetical protein